MTSEHPTPDEVRASIVPKSDQLNSEDLLTGPITVTITGVKRGDKDQPIVVEIEGRRPYKPCKTCRRVLIAVFGDEPKNWIGQRMTLFCDPEVVWAGVKVGGIRISHLSGLTNPRTFMLTQSRGKRSEVTIHPLPTLSAEDAAFLEAARKEVAEAKSLDVLKHYAKILEGKSEPVRDALRPVWKQRKAELEQETTNG